MNFFTAYCSHRKCKKEFVWSEDDILVKLNNEKGILQCPYCKKMTPVFISVDTAFIKQ